MITNLDLQKISFIPPKASQTTAAVVEVLFSFTTMPLETIVLEHVPASHKIHVAFFKSVSNAAFLQSQLLARNPDFEYAFIDASSVVSRLQVLAVTYKALSVLLDGTLRTPNVHSEIVTALSASNNVGLFIHLRPERASRADCESRYPRPTADLASRQIRRTSSS